LCGFKGSKIKKVENKMKKRPQDEPPLGFVLFSAHRDGRDALRNRVFVMPYPKPFVRSEKKAADEQQTEHQRDRVNDDFDKTHKDKIL